MQLMGRDVKGLSAGGVLRPLMTFLVVDSSPASRIGDCLSAIARQDYPDVECLVFDSCRSGGAAAAIDRLGGATNRFRLRCISPDETVQHLVASATEDVQGGFITILGGDDIVFPGFASYHVQVHLALPRSVSQSVSPTVVIDDTGRAVERGQSFDLAGETVGLDLRAPEIVLRLAEVSASEYLEISGWTSGIPSSRTLWLDAKDHVSVFRSSILGAVTCDPERIEDASQLLHHYRLFCHLLTGSALLDTPLSARRTQDILVSPARQSHGPCAEWTAGHWDRATEFGRERQRVLLEEIGNYAWMLGERYWEALDGISAIPPDGWHSYYRSDSVAALFRDFAPVLQKEFGDDSFPVQIGKRFGRTKGLYILSNAYRHRIPHQFLAHAGDADSSGSEA